MKICYIYFGCTRRFQCRKKVRFLDINQPMQGKRRGRNQISVSFFRSFTLIELLIVISIVAIMASILLPFLNKARQAGQGASCQSNLKQQGIAFIAYADDYEEYYPVESPGKPHLACIPLSPYLGVKGPVENGKYNPFRGYNGSKAFYCPAQNNRSTASNTSDYGGWHKRWNSNSFETVRVHRVKQPSASYLRLDSVYGWEPEYRTFGVVNITAEGHISYRHSERSNSLFFDGHVGTFSGKKLTVSELWLRMTVTSH